MLIRNATITGAVVGAGVASVLILLDQWMPFSVSINSFIDRNIFKVCPPYIVGFWNIIPNKAVWFLVAVLGNAVLYGALFALIAAGVMLLRKAVA